MLTPPLLTLPENPSVVIFDLDGTLCDSAEGIVTHLAMAFAEVGLPVPGRDVLRTCIGPTWDEWLPRIGVPVDAVGPLQAAYRLTYDGAAPSLAIPFPGIVEALGRLAEAGTAMAVATSKPGYLAARIVAEGPLAPYFAGVVGWDPEVGCLTKADAVARALALLGSTATPDAAAMVGDRLHDVHGAAAHGVATVGVRWGCAGPGELEEAGAAVLVDTPEALADLLLGTR